MDRLIAILGPTAVGKTRLAIDLALWLDSEIISGDSMQVYRGLDIGTAKPDAVERRGVTHHLIDILDPHADFSAADFQTQAAALITAINASGKIPILAGGTGLYVRALLEGYRFSPAPGSDALRRRLADLAERHGSAHLHALLREVSPATADRLHPNDQRRIIRALEVEELSGETVSQAKQAAEPVYNAVIIGLSMARDKLYQRINQRVDAMIAAGLADEVSALLAAGLSPASQSLQAIGYKQMVAYVRGETDLTTAAEQIKQATRNFAKRQFTWFSKMPYIEWINVDNYDDYNKMLAYIYSLVAGKFPRG